MRPSLYYLSHPEVVIDPAVPVPEWGLSDRGRARAEALAASAWGKDIVRIVSSRERKAIETAEILAAPRGLVPEIRAAMHENDRSATGYLPGPEFEDTADAFFANPDRSIRGWERARDAQARIVAAAEAEITATSAGSLLLVGHGGVGTLLWCHRAGLPISRTHDQPRAGCVWSAPLHSGTPATPWTPMETLAGTG